MNYFPPPPVSFDLVALASSAGGLNALSIILGALPASFPAAIVITQHLMPSHKTLLPLLLSHRSALLIKLAENDVEIKPGTVFIAPPDYHLIVNNNQTLSLSHDARVAFSRPSADVMLHSIAESFPKRAIAVILTGTGKDGSAGARDIHNAGGRVIAQDRSSASYFSMPQAAILTGCVDYILPLCEIPNGLIQLIKTGTLI